MKSLLQEEMHEEYKITDLKYFSSGRCVHLDIFAPKVNLAIEYQGEQHYADVHVFGEHRLHFFRDEEKRHLCIQVFLSTECKIC